MPPVYLVTSARSSPSPPPDSASFDPSTAGSTQLNGSQIRRRTRSDIQTGLASTRPQLDYNTTNSYLGGESTVDNDTTDGDMHVNRRTYAVGSNRSKSQSGHPPGESSEILGRTPSNRLVTPHRRGSPHAHSTGIRSAGPVASYRFITLLPDDLYLGALSVNVRSTTEHAILHFAVGLAAWRLYEQHEQRVASVLVSLLACSVIFQCGQPITQLFAVTKHVSSSESSVAPSGKGLRRTRASSPPQPGYLWMTDGKNYRECSDNGELTALLLAPLIAASSLYASICAPSSLPFKSNWYMEAALPLLETSPLLQTQATVASRRALVECVCLNTFLIFVHMYAASASRNWPRPENTLHQGRRIVLFVCFACVLTLVSVGLYEVSKAAKWAIFDEISTLDLICATFFFQTSLYVMIRMARRAFTLGEAVLVAHGATALFLETVNLSIIKQWPNSAQYVRTFREPSPLLVFQLALLPGTISIGFLLSPLLALSRHIAKRPRLRLKAPHQTEQLIYRRMLAIGIAAGTILLVGGLLGGWVRWMLGGRDPWLWVLRSLTQGRRPWSRPALVAWWGLLGSLSVAGWNRQLARSRRRLIHALASAQNSTQLAPKQKANIPQGFSEISAVGTYPPLVPRLGTQSAQAEASLSKGPTAAPTRDIQAVATDLLDAADKHVPTLSRNGRRKYFHALAVLMFVPGILWDSAFSHLSFSLAFSLFTFAEYIRYFAIYPFGAAVHVFLSEFLDEKDSGTAILSHFYLLTGCAMPLWLGSRSRILSLTGIIVLGVGDALASIVGRRMGRWRWFPSFGKTLEGSAAFASSVFFCGWAVAAYESESTNLVYMALAAGTTALLEAVSSQNDNLTTPLFMWCMLVLLPTETYSCDR